MVSLQLQTARDVIPRYKKRTTWATYTNSSLNYILVHNQNYGDEQILNQIPKLY